jgi:hypothetical protein
MTIPACGSQLGGARVCSPQSTRVIPSQQTKELPVNRNMIFRIGALSFVMLSLLGTAHGAEVTRFKLRDRSLIGSTQFASNDGCIVALLSVRFTESVTKTDGVTTVQPPTTTAEVDYSNGCTGEFLTLTGGTTTQTVHFAGDFGSATLQATVTVADENGDHATVVPLSLTWTANGPLQEAKDHTRTRDGNTVTVEKFDFKVRPADVTGSAPATLSTVEGPLTMDLALFSQGGTIGKDVFGERTVTKK